MWCEGEIWWTFDWYGSEDTFDYSLSEQPDEHKSGHFIALDNGEFAIQPNNRVRIFEPSFVTKPFPERPDYKVCTQFFNVEHMGKWQTSDDDRYMYGIKSDES